MNPTIYRYPLDGTGASPDNLVKDEEHQLSNRTIRCVAPTYGGFFADSVVVVDMATNLPLEHGKNKDYIFGELLEFPTGRYEKEIFSLIVIKRPGVSKVKITYQALGGDYSYSMDAIIAMIDNLNLGDRPVAWPDIIGKPPLFDPASHFHDLGDVYGFEYVVSALDRIRAAILLGDVASHDEIYRYIDRIDLENKTAIAAIRGDLTTHVNRQDNPHAVTKTQIGLSNIQNWAAIVNGVDIEGASPTGYVTPKAVHEFTTKWAITPFSTHIARTDNPHSVTKTQIGLGNVNNYPMSSVSEMEAGGATDRYVSPALVRSEINRLALVPLTEHISDRSNPHQTTKTQIGLSNVDNYATATDAIASTGVSNTNFMTPRLVRAEIQRLAITPLENHANRADNPHQTTKAQVGLSNVQNYPVATQENMSNGNGGAYLTPDVVKYYVENAAILPAQQHAARTDNPHGTTKAQVGLSNVVNYGVADQNQMAAGAAGVYTTADIVNNWVKAWTTPYQQHIGQVDNPHQTTKAQVGLGNVNNYPMASTAQMDAGTDFALYVSPGLVSRYVTTQLLPANNHIVRTDNPHNTTKAQVGLGNVNNYAMASVAEMDAGASSTLYVSPALVSRFVNINAYQPLQTHIGNTANPHNTTAAQVGLGNVSNYPIASSAEAQNGVANDRYMTPALVRVWMDTTFNPYLFSYKASNDEAAQGSRDDRWISAAQLQANINSRLGNYYTRNEVNDLVNYAIAQSRYTFTGGMATTPYSWTNNQGVVDTSNYFDVFPPAGFTMDNLVSFMASIGVIYFNGKVDENDTMRCIWNNYPDRVRVWIANSEQRQAPGANWQAIWK